MTAQIRTTARRLGAAVVGTAAVLAATTAGPGVAPAQQKAAAKAAPAAVPAFRVAVARNNAWSDEQFERWAFGNDNTVGGPRKKFESLLTLRVDEIDRACQLTDAQKQKLRLAAWGDTKRVFDAMDRAKVEFNKLGNDVQRLQDVVPLIQPVQEAAQGGVFGDGSVFAKSLRHTLTADQFAKYAAVEGERQAFKHRGQIRLAVFTLEQAMPLRDAQRAAVVDLLVKETKPAKAMGNEFYTLMGQIGRLPDDKLKPLLSAAQWKAWNQILARYKGFAGAARRAGADDDGDDAPPPGRLQK